MAEPVEPTESTEPVAAHRDTPGGDEPTRTPPPAPAGEERSAPAALLAALIAWLLPGAGHFFLRRWGRGALFFGLVLLCLAVGVGLHGKLWHFPAPGEQAAALEMLGTLGCAGVGLPFFALRFLLGYEGEVVAAGYEYGGAFILTAGLMNLLLVLDAWDIARGMKE